ncbi:hypothetical protein A9Q99_03130 [Gammaproteobacteria bacterium 45_16_T64]|nr:hypothetical protein A9Q99_03130 [Gammaproteobacteria bacterium 45_16_T64]
MKIKKYTCLYLLVSLLWVVSVYARADIAIVVHPENNSRFSDNDLKKIFLAKTKRFPSGKSASVLDQMAGSAIRKTFSRKMLNRSEKKLTAYWSRLIFTGKALPPKAVHDDREMMRLVGRNPKLIGYIDASSVDSTVRVIKVF